MHAFYARVSAGTAMPSVVSRGYPAAGVNGVVLVGIWGGAKKRQWSNKQSSEGRRNCQAGCLGRT